MKNSIKILVLCWNLGLWVGCSYDGKIKKDNFFNVIEKRD